MQVAEPTPRERATSVAAVALVHVALGYALLTGLGMSIPQKIEEGLKVVNLLPPPPPPLEPAVAEHKAAPRKSGEASAANLRSKATDVTAPEVKILPPPPLPMPAAAKANVGDEATSGATNIAGPGNGAGGVGNGFGSGGYGNGTGGGGGTDAELVSNKIRNSDTPEWVNGVMMVRMAIQIDAKGRISSCRIERSSGNAQLDQFTCRLVTQKVHFRPARDAAGHAVADEAAFEQTWYAYPRPDAATDDSR